MHVLVSLMLYITEKHKYKFSLIQICTLEVKSIFPLQLQVMSAINPWSIFQAIGSFCYGNHKLLLLCTSDELRNIRPTIVTMKP